MNKMGIAPIVNFLRPGFSWSLFFTMWVVLRTLHDLVKFFLKKSVLKICVVGKMVVILHRFCAKNGA